jgi:hypothetical protein
MIPTMLLAVALAAQAAAPAPVTRSVAFGAYSKKAAPVADLQASEITVEEEGQKRTVIALAPDPRPLDVAVIVDSSAAAAPVYRSDLVSAVMAFWRALPEGTKVAVFTSGPPSRLVDFGTDAAAAEPVLQKVACAGKNYAFEAMVDAARSLRGRPPARRALVFVGTAGIEASTAGTAKAMQAIGEAQVPPTVVLLTTTGASAPIGGMAGGQSSSWDVEGFFGKMTQSYGGSFASVLSSQAAAKWLALSAAELSAPYLLRYESTSGPAKPVTVNVSRKDVKLRVGRPQLISLRLVTGEALATASR